MNTSSYCFRKSRGKSAARSRNLNILYQSCSAEPVMQSCRPRGYKGLLKTSTADALPAWGQLTPRRLQCEIKAIDF
ncbi:UNVERIFIED_CONTAM: hypothetical protein FKN15_017877 [Acipenser sinensis]